MNSFSSTNPAMNHSGSNQTAYLGPYQIVEEIGRGGMGIVYKARHHQLQRLVALKVLIAGEDASEEAIVRFLREAESVARLGHHPHIVPVYDMGCQGRMHYFAMHFVEGRPLDKLIELGEVAPLRAAILTDKVAQGLSHAHSHNILHRDIKPENILVDKDGEPKIGDFGLAKDVAEGEGLTRTGSAMGTPSYMSPEQADGDPSAIDARSDVYSLGASLYEMLTGEPPFKGQTMLATLNKVLTQDPVEPRKINPGIPKDLESICLKCLDKEPERRYQSAEELSEDLQRFLNSEPVAAQPITAARRLRLWQRRNKSLFLMMAVTTTALLISGLLTLWSLVLAPRLKRQQQRQRQQLLTARSQNFIKSERDSALAKLEASDSGVAKQAWQDLQLDSLNTRLQASLKDMSLTKDEREQAQALVAAENWQPLLSQAAYKAKQWVLAYRSDPLGLWGIRALTQLARGLNSRRDFDKAAQQLLRALRRLDRLSELEEGRRKTLRTEILSELASSYQNLGELEGLASCLEELKQCEGLSKDQQRLRAVLEEITERRQVFQVTPRPVFGMRDIVDEFSVLKLDRTVFCLTARAGRPTFAVEDKRLKRVDSPFRAIPEGDLILTARAADFNHDGQPEIAAGVFRRGEGGGVVVLEGGQGRWRVVYEKFGQEGFPNEIQCGHLSEPGHPEALILFSYKSHYQWKLEYQRSRNAWDVTAFEPPMDDRKQERPWCFGMRLHDLDGDGLDEVLLGRSVQIKGQFQVLKWDRGKQRLQKVSELTLGQARSTVVTPSGQVAVLVHNNSDYLKRYPRFDFGARCDGMALLSYQSGQLSLTRSFPTGTQNFRPGALLRTGTLFGKPALVWYCHVSRSEEEKLVYYGQRLFVLSSPFDSSTELSFGFKKKLSGLLLWDIDGDGKSEWLTVQSVARGRDELVVRGRRREPLKPLRLEPEDNKARAPTQELLESVLDLVNSGQYEQARAMYFDLAEKYKDQPLGRSAEWLGFENYRTEMEQLERRWFRLFEGDQPKRFASAKEELEGLTKRATEHIQERLRGRPMSQMEERRLRGLLLKIYARTENWRAYRELLEASLERHVNPVGALSGRAKQQLFEFLDSKDIVEGCSFLNKDWPLIADLPLRLGRKRLAGKEVFVHLMDPHSARHVVGHPIAYAGGSFEWQLDFRIELGMWETRGHLGLIPRKSLHDFRTDPHAGFQHFENRTGAIGLSLGSTRGYSQSGPRFAIPGRPWTGQHSPYTVDRRIHYRYYAELQELVVDFYQRHVEDSAMRLVMHTRVPAQSCPRGQYVFGLSFYHHAGNGQLYNSAQGSRVPLVIQSSRFRAFDAQLDEAAVVDSDDLLQNAGGMLARDHREQAVSLYRKALEANALNHRARVHLAYLTADSKLLAEGFARDPYGFMLALDDAFRGCDSKLYRTMAQLLEPVKSQFPEYVAALAGDMTGLERLKERSTAHSYARNRLRVFAVAGDLSYLRNRELRGPGTELQDYFWSPGDDLQGAQRALLAQLKNPRYTGQEWHLWSRLRHCQPNNPQVILGLARVALKYNRAARAVGLLWQAVERLPKDQSLRLNLLALLAQYQEPQQFIQALEQAYEAGFSDQLIQGPSFQKMRDHPVFKAWQKRRRP